jgi:GntR family phosphonate transport system transcriptional regulator
MTSRGKQKILEVTSGVGIAPDPVARGSGIALWRQIAQDLETDILSARLAPGDRLPTETELAARYSVNRHTLRRALSELTQKGLVEATPRLGTFVTKSRLAYPISKDTRFSEIVARAGREPGGRLLSKSEGAPPPEVAAHLLLPGDAEAIQLELMRIANNEPICLSTNWFPAGRFPRIGQFFAQTRSITKSLKMSGVPTYRRKLSRISARPANSAERSALGLNPGDTVLVVEAINVDAEETPIQVTRARFSADRVELVVES